MKFLKICLFLLLLLGSFFLGYGNFGSWWKFIPSSFLIVLVVFIFYPKSWQRLLGLEVSLKDLLMGGSICFVFSFVSYFAIKASLPHGYQLGFGSHWQFSSFVNSFFQSLNEEFLFRALLINGLLFLGWSQTKIVFIPAVFFAFSHWFFYKFNLSHVNHGTVELKALLTLFFFGVSMSLIFLKTKIIIIPFALHAAWNFNRFALGLVKSDEPYNSVPEFLSFNLLEGSNFFLVLSLVLCFGSFAFFRRTKYL